MPSFQCGSAYFYAQTEVTRRKDYIDQISDESLKQLVISCLHNNPGRHPPTSQVCERIATTIVAAELNFLYWACNSFSWALPDHDINLGHAYLLQLVSHTQGNFMVVNHSKYYCW